jgi:hypothetical protein
MRTVVQKNTIFFKKVKTYSAEEIIKAGGTTAFGKQTGYNPDKLKNIPIGEVLTDKEYNEALQSLTK